MYAHKLATYTNDAHKPVPFCVNCGHETDLNGPCSGKYVLSEKEQKQIDAALEKGFKEIFATGVDRNSERI